MSALSAYARNPAAVASIGEKQTTILPQSEGAVSLFLSFAKVFAYLFRFKCYDWHEHLLQGYSSVLEGVAIELCVVVEIVRVRKEIIAGTEHIAAADIGAR